MPLQACLRAAMSSRYGALYVPVDEPSTEPSAYRPAPASGKVRPRRPAGDAERVSTISDSNHALSSVSGSSSTSSFAILSLCLEASGTTATRVLNSTDASLITGSYLSGIVSSQPAIPNRPGFPQMTPPPPNVAEGATSRLTLRKKSPTPEG